MLHELSHLQELAAVTEGKKDLPSTTSINRGQKIRELTSEGRDSEVLPLLNEVLEERVETFGETHPDTIKTMSSIARLLQSLGRPEDALPIFEGVLAGRRKNLSLKHPFVRLAPKHKMTRLRTSLCINPRVGPTALRRRPTPRRRN